MIPFALGSMCSLSGAEREVVLLAGPFASSCTHADYIVAPFYRRDLHGFSPSINDVAVLTADGERGFVALWAANTISSGTLLNCGRRLTDSFAAHASNAYWSLVTGAAEEVGHRRAPIWRRRKITRFRERERRLIRDSASVAAQARMRHATGEWNVVVSSVCLRKGDSGKAADLRNWMVIDSEMLHTMEPDSIFDTGVVPSARRSTLGNVYVVGISSEQFAMRPAFAKIEVQPPDQSHTSRVVASSGDQTPAFTWPVLELA